MRSAARARSAGRQRPDDAALERRQTVDGPLRRVLAGTRRDRAGTPLLPCRGSSARPTAAPDRSSLRAGRTRSASSRRTPAASGSISAIAWCRLATSTRPIRGSLMRDTLISSVRWPFDLSTDCCDSRRRGALRRMGGVDKASAAARRTPHHRSSARRAPARRPTRSSSSVASPIGSATLASASCPTSYADGGALGGIYSAMLASPMRSDAGRRLRHAVPQPAAAAAAHSGAGSERGHRDAEDA